MKVSLETSVTLTKEEVQKIIADHLNEKNLTRGTEFKASSVAFHGDMDGDLTYVEAIAKQDNV